MKKIIFPVVLMLFCSAPAFCVKPVKNSVPKDYSKKVLEMNDARFTDNDIKSFVYLFFAMYDKHVPVENYMSMLSSHNLFMKFPETTVSSYADFIKWYESVGRSIKSNLHDIESISVRVLKKNTYEAKISVTWQAVDRNGKYISLKSLQTWILADKGGQWPVITSYIVEPDEDK